MIMWFLSLSDQPRRTDARRVEARDKEIMTTAGVLNNCWVVGPSAGIFFLFCFATSADAMARKPPQ